MDLNGWDSNSLRLVLYARELARVERNAIRLSKEFLGLPTSVFLKGNFVAYDVKGEPLLGKGGHAKIKPARLPNGTLIARRTSPWLRDGLGMRVKALLNGRRGIIPTLAIGAYHGKTKYCYVEYMDLYQDLCKIPPLTQMQCTIASISSYAALQKSGK